MANVAEAVGLVKEFRDFWNRPKAKAVNDIDFEVREGEVLGLLGPNGSGKSTTVKMLLGLLYPTAGRLSVFGVSPRSIEAKRLIGYLPEETYLYKYLTAWETLDFFGSLFNLSPKERAARADQLLEMVGLSHARNRQVGEFSKGMARRIGLAQAMINDPQFLVLDEPTSGLDPIGCKEVKDLIHLLKKRGKTVLVTSHLLGDVSDVCDRVIILYGGKIRAQGPLNELLTEQKNTCLTLPDLPDAVRKKVEQVLAENGQSYRMDHPRKTLEEFFLSVVDQAKKESLSTSGATSGGVIAEYLSSGVSAEEKLRKLSGKAEEAKAEEPDQAQELARKTEEENKRIREVLSEPEKAKEEETRIREKTEEEKQHLEEANRKLSGLLGPRNGK